MADRATRLRARRGAVRTLAAGTARSHCECATQLPFSVRIPYLVAFDYLITYIDDHLRTNLGRTARGMMILDRKDQFEFSYPVDSSKNPMIQISDLVVVCARRFLEIEHGYRPDWSDAVKDFYAECYSRIHGRIRRRTLVPRGGQGMDAFNRYLAEVQCTPVGQRRRRYGLR
jgi:hypothetical protein